MMQKMLLQSWRTLASGWQCILYTLLQHIWQIDSAWKCRVRTPLLFTPSMNSQKTPKHRKWMIASLIGSTASSHRPSHFTPRRHLVNRLTVVFCALVIVRLLPPSQLRTQSPSLANESDHPCPHHPSRHSATERKLSWERWQRVRKRWLCRAARLQDHGRLRPSINLRFQPATNPHEAILETLANRVLPPIKPLLPLSISYRTCASHPFPNQSPLHARNLSRPPEPRVQAKSRRSMSHRTPNGPVRWPAKRVWLSWTQRSSSPRSVPSRNREKGCHHWRSSCWSIICIQPAASQRHIYQIPSRWET